MKNRSKRRMPLPIRKALVLAIIGWQLALISDGSAADLDQAKQDLNQWLRHQSAIQTWNADVLQIRKLKTLTRPLETEGRVWFSQPNRFRWQLGDPPRTIAVRTRDALLIAYPRLKRVEKIPLDNGLDSSWRYVMALLDVGFPNAPETFYANYNLIGAEKLDDHWRFDLQPVSRQARRLVESVRLETSVPDLELQATELAFPDGSIMRNEFRNIAVNPDLEQGLFNFEIPPDYQVVNPLAGSRK